MGRPKLDDIFAVLLLNTMNDNFGPIQQSLNSLSSTPNFNAEMIASWMLDEDALVHRHVELGQPANPYIISHSSATLSAFATLSSCPHFPRFICANCKHNSHTADFCVSPGGKMAGRHVEDAKATYRAFVNRQRTSQPARLPRTHNPSAHIAFPSVPTPISSSVSNTSSSGTVFFNGLPYVPDPSWTDNTPSSAHITEIPSSPDTNGYQNHACLAVCDSSPSPSISPSFLSVAFSVSSSSFPSVVQSSSSLSFIIDTGATCHISPSLSVFESIRPIQPHPIKGLGGLSVHTLRVGTIKLQTAFGHIALNDAFFVPKSSVHLISVFLLEDADYNAHFYPRQHHCFIADARNSIVARGLALPNCKLFILSNASVLLPHPISPASYAHYTSRVPDVDTWHKCLGHCGSRTVIDMARSNAVQGMKIDLFSPPPKCEHCILGKQTRSSVPKVREGERANALLGRVYVDLCGPMSIPSRTGRLYSMNIIDDFSGFIWSIPLCFKDEAAPALKAWLLGLKVQTPHRLKSFVTDNGELASLHIHQWCTEKGILHSLTAPYTSAHNGHAERLHCTLMDKARAMHSACRSPLNMWDEFCATTACISYQLHRCICK
jgi:hypothetical protein